MDLFTLYLVSLLVGGFFVLLSIFGGGENDADADADVDFDADADLEMDLDAGGDADLSAGPGWVDLFSVRALFLFAAFFGLTGVALTWLGTGEPIVLLLAMLMGLVTGLGGNYVIKRVGYAHVSSNVTGSDLKGVTAKVVVPFQSGERGKISLVARGHRLHLLARGLADAGEAFAPGDEVVVVRMDGTTAEVVKPD